MTPFLEVYPPIRWASQCMKRTKGNSIPPSPGLMTLEGSE